MSRSWDRSPSLEAHVNDPPGRHHCRVCRLTLSSEDEAQLHRSACHSPESPNVDGGKCIGQHRHAKINYKFASPEHSETYMKDNDMDLDFQDTHEGTRHFQIFRCADFALNPRCRAFFVLENGFFCTCRKKDSVELCKSYKKLIAIRGCTQHDHDDEVGKRALSIERQSPTRQGHRSNRSRSRSRPRRSRSPPSRFVLSRSPSRRGRSKSRSPGKRRPSSPSRRRRSRSKSPLRRRKSRSRTPPRRRRSRSKSRPRFDTVPAGDRREDRDKSAQEKAADLRVLQQEYDAVLDEMNQVVVNNSTSNCYVHCDGHTSVTPCLQTFKEEKNRFEEEQFKRHIRLVHDDNSKVRPNNARHDCNLDHSHTFLSAKHPDFRSAMKFLQCNGIGKALKKIEKMPNLEEWALRCTESKNCRAHLLLSVANACECKDPRFGERCGNSSTFVDLRGCLTHNHDSRVKEREMTSRTCRERAWSPVSTEHSPQYKHCRTCGLSFVGECLSKHYNLVHQVSTELPFDHCTDHMIHQYQWTTDDQTGRLSNRRFLFDSKTQASEFLRLNKFFTSFFLSSDEVTLPDFKHVVTFKCGKADQGCGAKIFMAAAYICDCLRETEDDICQKYLNKVFVFGCFAHQHKDEKQVATSGPKEIGTTQKEDIPAEKKHDKKVLGKESSKVVPAKKQSEKTAVVSKIPCVSCSFVATSSTIIQSHRETAHKPSRPSLKCSHPFGASFHNIFSLRLNDEQDLKFFLDSNGLSRLYSGPGGYKGPYGVHKCKKVAKDGEDCVAFLKVEKEFHCVCKEMTGGKFHEMGKLCPSNRAFPVIRACMEHTHNTEGQTGILDEPMVIDLAPLPKNLKHCPICDVLISSGEDDQALHIEKHHPSGVPEDMIICAVDHSHQLFDFQFGSCAKSLGFIRDNMLDVNKFRLSLQTSNTRRFICGTASSCNASFALVFNYKCGCDKYKDPEKCKDRNVCEKPIKVASIRGCLRHNHGFGVAMRQLTKDERPEQKPLHCYECSEVFESLEGLLNHRKTKCQKVSPDCLSRAANFCSHFSHSHLAVAGEFNDVNAFLSFMEKNRLNDIFRLQTSFGPNDPRPTCFRSYNCKASDQFPNCAAFLVLEQKGRKLCGCSKRTGKFEKTKFCEKVLAQSGFSMTGCIQHDHGRHPDEGRLAELMTSSDVGKQKIHCALPSCTRVFDNEPDLRIHAATDHEDGDSSHSPIPCNVKHNHITIEAEFPTLAPALKYLRDNTLTLTFSRAIDDSEEMNSYICKLSRHCNAGFTIAKHIICACGHLDDITRKCSAWTSKVKITGCLTHNHTEQPETEEKEVSSSSLHLHCSQCAILFTEKESLRKHIEAAHGKMDSCKLKHDHEPYLGSFVGAITKKMQDDFNKDAGNTKAFVRFNNAMICPRGKIKANPCPARVRLRETNICACPERQASYAKSPFCTNPVPGVYAFGCLTHCHEVNEVRHCDSCEECFLTDRDLSVHLKSNHSLHGWCPNHHDHIYLRRTYPDFDKSLEFLNVLLRFRVMMKESDLGERFHKAPKRNSADPVRRFKALCANSDRFNCTAKAIWTDGMVCKCTDEEKRNCGKKCKVFEPAILVDGCLIHSQMCDERALEQTRALWHCKSCKEVFETEDLLSDHNEAFHARVWCPANHPHMLTTEIFNDLEEAKDFVAGNPLYNQDMVFEQIGETERNFKCCNNVDPISCGAQFNLTSTKICLCDDSGAPQGILDGIEDPGVYEFKCVFWKEALILRGCMVHNGLCVEEKMQAEGLANRQQLMQTNVSEKIHCQSCREAFESEDEQEDHFEMNHAGQWCGFDHEHIYTRESFPNLQAAKVFVKDHPLFSQLEHSQQIGETARQFTCSERGGDSQCGATFVIMSAFACDCDPRERANSEDCTKWTETVILKGCMTHSDLCIQKKRGWLHPQSMSGAGGLHDEPGHALAGPNPDTAPANPYLAAQANAYNMARPGPTSEGLPGPSSDQPQGYFPPGQGPPPYPQPGPSGNQAPYAGPSGGNFGAPPPQHFVAQSLQPPAIISRPPELLPLPTQLPNPAPCVPSQAYVASDEIKTVAMEDTSPQSSGQYQISSKEDLKQTPPAASKVGFMCKAKHMHKLVNRTYKTQEEAMTYIREADLDLDFILTPSKKKDVKDDTEVDPDEEKELKFLCSKSLSGCKAQFFVKSARECTCLIPVPHKEKLACPAWVKKIHLRGCLKHRKQCLSTLGYSKIKVKSDEKRFIIDLLEQGMSVPETFKSFQRKFSNRAVIEFYVRKLALAYNLKPFEEENKETVDSESKELNVLSVGGKKGSSGAKGIQFFLAKKEAPPPLPKIDEWWSMGDKKKGREEERSSNQLTPLTRAQLDKYKEDPATKSLENKHSNSLQDFSQKKPLKSGSGSSKPKIGSSSSETTKTGPPSARQKSSDSRRSPEKSRSSLRRSKSPRKGEKSKSPDRKNRSQRRRSRSPIRQKGRNSRSPNRRGKNSRSPDRRRRSSRSPERRRRNSRTPDRKPRSSRTPPRRSRTSKSPIGRRNRNSRSPVRRGRDRSKSPDRRRSRSGGRRASSKSPTRKSSRRSASRSRRNEDRRRKSPTDRLNPRDQEKKIVMELEIMQSDAIEKLTELRDFLTNPLISSGLKEDRIEHFYDALMEVNLPPSPPSSSSSPPPLDAWSKPSTSFDLPRPAISYPLPQNNSGGGGGGAGGGGWW